MKTRNEKLKLGFEPIEAVDIDAILNEQKEAEKRAEDVKKGRLSNLKCPVCKSTNKKHIVKSENNGIFGPGYHSWITEDYFICQDCGVMYKDISKST